jgi:hypothetical protein
MSLNLFSVSIYNNQLNQSEALDLGPDYKQDQIKILFQHTYSNSESLIKQKSTAAGSLKIEWHLIVMTDGDNLRPPSALKASSHSFNLMIRCSSGHPG